MRRLLMTLSLIPLAACTATGSSPKPSPSTTTTEAAGCTTDTIHSDPPPAWADSAHPPAGMRWVAGRNGLVVGMLFTDPMASGQQVKILWIVKQPRDGNPLQVQATLKTPPASVAFFPVSPDSGPGEIYPWSVAVPTPGCWQFRLTWGAVQDFVAVPFS